MADTVVTPGEGGASITGSLAPDTLALLLQSPPRGAALLVTTSVSSVQFSSDGWKKIF